MELSLNLTRRCFALLAATSAISSQNSNRFDSIVRSCDDAFMGNILVVRKSRVLFQHSYGCANLEWNISNVPDGKFRIGSMSKQFTAACVLLLVMDGKLDLDSSVTKYLPGAPPAWRPITLHHLLTHTSGIPNLTSFAGFQETKTLHSSLAQTLERFRDLPLEFPPGTDGRYSNSGYIVLANVVEHVAHQEFVVFLNSRVLTPLGLSDTGTDTFRTILRHRVSGYTRFSEGLGNTDYIDMSIPLGAGSLYSTTGDLYRWTIALQRNDFIRSDLLKRMLTPTRHNYGYGVEIRTEQGGRIIGHGGGIEGFNSFLQYREKDALVVAVLANINTGVTGKLANDLASAARES